MPRQTDRFVLPSVLPQPIPCDTGRPIPCDTGRCHQRRRPDRVRTETATCAVRSALGISPPEAAFTQRKLVSQISGRDEILNPHADQTYRDRSSGDALSAKPVEQFTYGEIDRLCDIGRFR